MECVTTAIPLPWQWQPSKRLKNMGDEFFDEGYMFCYSSKQLLIDLDTVDEHQCHPEFPCCIAGCWEVFSTIISYEMHYNSVHRNTCSQCRRPFPSNHLLEIHLRERHDPLFQAQPGAKYQCLLVHCDVKFDTTKSRKNHMIKTHRYPSNYRFDRSKPKQQTSRPTTGEEMDVGEPVNGNMPSQSKRAFSYKVPQSICFGQGATRSFPRPCGRRKPKHWHQTGMDIVTTVDIENVKMDDLNDALGE